MKEKLALLTTTIMLLFISTGCWDRIELEDRDIVVGIGIDKADFSGNIVLTLDTVIPSKIGTAKRSVGGIQKAVHVYTAEAESLDDAIRMIAIRQKGYIYFGQNRLIVISSQAAKEGIKPLLDFFTRSIESNPQIAIIISKDKASDVLNLRSDIFQIPSDYITSAINARNYFSNGIVQNLHEFTQNFSDGTTSSATSFITLITNEDKTNEIDALQTAVFKKDRLAGTLDMAQTRGLAWIFDQYPEGSVEIKEDGTHNTKLTERVLRAQTKIRSEFMDDGKIGIIIDVDQEGNLIMQDGSISLDSQQDVENIEKKLTQSVKSDIESCLAKVQKEYQSDILGFGKVIQAEHPKYWKDIKEHWDNEFPNIKVDIQVKSKVRGIGAINNIENK